MQCSFARDSSLSGMLFDFLETVFPGLSRAARNAARLGASWEAVSTPFIGFLEGRPVAHVGVLELPLIVLGRPVNVASIHAVATHPDHRRRGWYRGVMEEALRYCSGRWATALLTTEHPEYFEPFGFRFVREHLFTVRPRPTRAGTALRLMNLEDAGDVALLNRLLETREPVSRVLGVVKEKAVFCFNEGSRPLYYSEDLDVMVCMEMEGATLRLFDVVGPGLPSLDVLLARLPQPVEEVAASFAMDRFAAEALAQPYILDHGGPSHLMVRGPLAAEGKAFTLPRSART